MTILHGEEDSVQSFNHVMAAKRPNSNGRLLALPVYYNDHNDLSPRARLFPYSSMESLKGMTKTMSIHRRQKVQFQYIYIYIYIYNNI